MKNRTPVYELAPVSASTAEFLTKVYGALGIDEFTKSLPRSAQVLDVGAGNSDLGRVITNLRPDITWTNFDIEYSSAELNRLAQGAPKNLRFLNGDILNPHVLRENSYDRIYTFWVLPHLGLENPSLIRVGIVNMLNLLKDNQASKLTVGPLVAKRTGQVSTHYLSVEVDKNVSEVNLANIVWDCTIPKGQAGFYRAQNRAGLAIFKNRQRTGQNPTRLGLWDIQRGQYVKAFSIRGLFLMARFRIYLAIEKFRKAKY